MLSFHDDCLDCVYIDTNHSHPPVTKDVTLSWPKLRTKGVFAGHDYLGGHIEPYDEFGVKRAIDDFAKSHDQKVYVTPEEWPTCRLLGFLRKQSLPAASETDQPDQAS
jgi:hypothetical protein